MATGEVCQITRKVACHPPADPGRGRLRFSLVTAAASRPTADDRDPVRVLVYSDNRTVRRDVILALGTRPAADLPAVQIVECATEPALIIEADRGGLDLLILDGEAAPAGGMGIARQLKDEIFNCPPILVLIARPQDAWLATWSKADGVTGRPVNAIDLPKAAAALLRDRLAGLPAAR